MQRGVPARAVLLAAVWLLGACISGAHAAALQEISRDRFQAQVTRLQSVVVACESASATCNSDAVGADVQVGDAARGGFEEHWQWLRDALDKAKITKGDERAAMLRAAMAQLNDLAQESRTTRDEQQEREFRRMQAQAKEVLARPEFQRVAGTSWWDRAKAWMGAWIERFFLGVAQVGAAAPWLGTLLEWMFLIGAAAGVMFLLLRNVSRQRLRVSLGDAALQHGAWDREAEDWAARAEQCATAQEWRDAVHCIYWAAIVSLESRRAWRHNPARTPREYVSLLQPGSTQQWNLRSLTGIFERVWYGSGGADEVVYAEARKMYAGIAAGGDETRNAHNAADETLRAGGAA